MIKEYNCLYCGTLSRWSNRKHNVYCGVLCSNEHVKCLTFLKFINGDIKENKTIKRILTDLNINTCSVCSVCGILPEWNNKPLTLQVDHIDGNSDNCNPVNVRLICPNCHSQTDTFSNKLSIKKNTRRNKYLQKYKGNLVREA